MKDKLLEAIDNKTLKMEAISFMDGLDGSHQQTFRDKKLGVTASKLKEDHNTPWVMIITADIFPDKEFKTLAELREALVKDCKC